MKYIEGIMAKLNWRVTYFKEGEEAVWDKIRES